jgi:hypothetical protein
VGAGGRARRDGISPIRGAVPGDRGSRGARRARRGMPTTGRGMPAPGTGAARAAPGNRATRTARIGWVGVAVATGGPNGPPAPALAGRAETVTNLVRGGHRRSGPSNVPGAEGMRPRPGAGLPTVPTAARCPDPGAGVGSPGGAPHRFHRPAHPTPGGPPRGLGTMTAVVGGAMTPEARAAPHRGNRRSGSTRASCVTRRPEPWSAAARAARQGPRAGRAAARRLSHESRPLVATAGRLAHRRGGADRLAPAGAAAVPGPQPRATMTSARPSLRTACPASRAACERPARHSGVSASTRPGAS